MIVDAEGIVLGRLSSLVAKKALLGESIVVVNAEKALISGKKEDIVARNLRKLEIKNKGNYTDGPFHQKRADRFVRASIRGMLPNKKSRGSSAFDNIMVYVGVPKDEILKRHGVDVSKEKIVKLKDLSRQVDSYLTVGELCKAIGGSF